MIFSQTCAWTLPFIQLPPRHTWIKHPRLCIYFTMACDFCCCRISGTRARNPLGQSKETQSQSQTRGRRAAFPSAQHTLSQQDGASCAHSPSPLTPQFVIRKEKGAMLHAGQHPPTQGVCPSLPTSKDISFFKDTLRKHECFLLQTGAQELNGQCSPCAPSWDTAGLAPGTAQGGVTACQASTATASATPDLNAQLLARPPPDPGSRHSCQVPAATPHLHGGAAPKTTALLKGEGRVWCPSNKSFSAASVTPLPLHFPAPPTAAGTHGRGGSTAAAKALVGFAVCISLLLKSPLITLKVCGFWWQE